MDDGFDMPGPEESSPVANRTSFTEMDRTDDDPPPQSDPRLPTSPIVEKSIHKYKRRVSDEDMHEVEDEIERGLNELDNMNESDEETAVEMARPKKGKKVAKENRPPRERKKEVKRKRPEPQLQLSGA